MPVEIKELIIRAVVDPPQGGAGARQATSSSSNAEANDRQEIIRDCVEQILEILREQRER